MYKTKEALLGNLKVIRDELKNRNWAVDAFHFHFKKKVYVVLVKLYMPGEEKDNNFAIVKLEFIKIGQNLSFSTYADLYKINIPNIKKFREFFEIEYAENLGDIIKQFTIHFSTFIPNRVKGVKDTSLTNSIKEYLKKSDAGTYCYAVKRNGLKKDGKLAQRSPENNQKAALLRPTLYEHFKTETNISFYFSEDPAKVRTDDEILLSYSNKDN
ncbi:MULTISPECIES: DUF6037 family protein [Bacillus]|uniref:DUF6037 family protein n=1 Tax=Bacillus TaxID=1386 RepID=UPI00273F7D3F|nr:DUF6037 family protein [Bacillus sp. MMSF_3328]